MAKEHGCRAWLKNGTLEGSLNPMHVTFKYALMIARRSAVFLGLLIPLSTWSMAPSEEARSSKQVLLERAEIFLERDDRNGYLETLDQLHAQFPGDPEVRDLCGGAWLRLGEWQRLLPLLEANRVETDVPLETFREGMEAAKQGDLLRGLILLEAAHRAAPEEPGILLNLGSYYCRFQRCEHGIALFRKLTEVRPNTPRAFVALAKAAKVLGLPEEGMAAVYRAEELIRGNPEHEKRFADELEDLLVFFLDLQAHAT